MRAKETMSEIERHGEDIVLVGQHKGYELQAVMAGGVVVQGQDTACSRCHGTWFEGQVEGFNQAPGISAVKLAAAAKKAGKSPEVLLEDALVRGIGIDGRVLSGYMPRFNIRRQDLIALQAWFSAKDFWFDYGVTETEIFIGLIDGRPQQSFELANHLNKLQDGYRVFGRKLRFEVVRPSGVNNSTRRYFAYLNPESLPIEEPGQSLVFSFEHRNDGVVSAERDSELFLLDSHKSWKSSVMKYFPAVQDAEAERSLHTCKGQFLIGAAVKRIVTECQQKLRDQRDVESEFYVRWVDPPAEAIGLADLPATLDPNMRAMLIRSSILIAILRKALEQIGEQPKSARLFQKLKLGHGLQVDGFQVSFSISNQAGLHGAFVLRWDRGAGSYRLHWQSF